MYFAHARAYHSANGVYSMPRPSGPGWPGHRHTGDDWGMDTDSRDTIIRELREENASLMARVQSPDDREAALKAMVGP